MLADKFFWLGYSQVLLSLNIMAQNEFPIANFSDWRAVCAVVNTFLLSVPPVVVAPLHISKVYWMKFTHPLQIHKKPLFDYTESETQAFRTIHITEMSRPHARYKLVGQKP